MGPTDLREKQQAVLREARARRWRSAARQQGVRPATNAREPARGCHSRKRWKADRAGRHQGAIVQRGNLTARRLRAGPHPRIESKQKRAHGPPVIDRIWEDGAGALHRRDGHGRRRGRRGRCRFWQRRLRLSQRRDERTNAGGHNGIDIHSWLTGYLSSLTDTGSEQDSGQYDHNDLFSYLHSILSEGWFVDSAYFDTGSSTKSVTSSGMVWVG